MRTLLIIGFLGFALSLMGQQSQQVFEAIASQKLENLEKHLAANLELCIDDEQNYYSKQEALSSLRSFLNRTKPLKIVKKHKGNSSSQKTNYRVATLITENGKYRVFIYLERMRDSKKITEIRLDPIH